MTQSRRGVALEQHINELRVQILGDGYVFGGDGGGGRGLKREGSELCETPEMMHNAPPDVRFSFFHPFKYFFFLANVFPSSTIACVLLYYLNFRFETSPPFSGQEFLLEFHLPPPLFLLLTDVNLGKKILTSLGSNSSDLEVCVCICVRVAS